MVVFIPDFSTVAVKDEDKLFVHSHTSQLITGSQRKEKTRVFCLTAKPGGGDNTHGPRAAVHLLKEEKDTRKGRLALAHTWKLAQLSRIEGGSADTDGDYFSFLILFIFLTC